MAKQATTAATKNDAGTGADQIGELEAANTALKGALEAAKAKHDEQAMQLAARDEELKARAADIETLKTERDAERARADAAVAIDASGIGESRCLVGELFVLLLPHADCFYFDQDPGRLTVCRDEAAAVALAAELWRNQAVDAPVRVCRVVGAGSRAQAAVPVCEVGPAGKVTQRFDEPE